MYASWIGARSVFVVISLFRVIMRAFEIIEMLLTKGDQPYFLIRYFCSSASRLNRFDRNGGDFAVQVDKTLFDHGTPAKGGWYATKALCKHFSSSSFKIFIQWTEFLKMGLKLVIVGQPVYFKYGRYIFVLQKIFDNSKQTLLDDTLWSFSFHWSLNIVTTILIWISSHCFLYWVGLS